MSVSFNSFPSSWNVPLFYAEVDSSQAGTGSTTTHPAIFIGQKLAAGNAVSNKVYAIGSVAVAKRLFGEGSMLERMVYRLFKVYPAALLYCMAVDDPTGGVAASQTTTVTGTATESGVISLYVAGQLVNVGVKAGDAAAAIATNIAAAVNAMTTLPSTAAAVSGVVTYTCQWKGATGNDIVITDTYLGSNGGQALPAGITLVHTVATNGAGVPNFEDAIIALGETQYDFVGLPYTDSGTLDLFDIEYGFGDTGRWGWMRELYGAVWSARRDTYSNLMTWGPTGNSAVESVLAVEPASPSPVWDWTAAYTSAAIRGLANDPARPLQTLEMTGVLPAPSEQRFTVAQMNNLVSVGIAIQKVNPNGYPAIIREAMRYQQNSYGQADNAYALATTLYTLAEIFRRLKGAITSKYPRHKLANDGTVFASGQAIITPKIIKAELVSEYSDMEYDGLVENLDAFASNLVVERNSTNPDRVDVLYPPDIINGLRIFAVLAQFRLQYSSAS
ncbi:phage tail sheath gpL-like [Rhizobium sp. ERR 1071]|uniref:phage tail sheath C-terminal domain-containing protein n=1 Tax=Rhizobium sp. ERR 1071 TaxID=2572677 RepID=UPI00119A6394|nr:phage tail sheath C-terminal domain-containing protein [Rhizobium sp. ERR1071]TWB19514.1 phage tail sheath gpL-like [Rhizobium sp. ERR1071]